MLHRGELPDVLADPAVLRPAFVNLMANAVKFSRLAPQPRVDIDATANGDEVVVRVRDNGVGFDDSQAASLFQPFRRLHGAAYEGTGLGLSIVRLAVDRHGGRVWAQSAPGHGATFAFTLPGAAYAAAPSPQPAAVPG